MIRALQTTWFPLLRKELIEQAARKRTFIIRFVFACGLVLIFCIMAHNLLGVQSPLQQRTPIYLFARVPFQGTGASLFMMMLALQFAAVFLFLPAMMSGVLTAEKERDSMSLLMLSDLRPWEILLEKCASRLIPLLSVLMLALPLYAVAYSLGGVTSSAIACGTYLLIVTALQVGAIALMCSSYCRTTAAAFVMSYLLVVLFYLASALLQYTGRWAGGYPYLFPGLGVFSLIWGASLLRLVGASIPALLSIAGFLGLARYFLLRRALVRPRRLLLRAFRRLDKFFEWMNEWAAGGIMLVKSSHSLPEEDPVYWREVTKKALGRANYLFRVLALVEVPILMLGLSFIMFGSPPSNTTDVSRLMFLLWCLAALAIAAVSPNALISERNSQTLEVLLATPLTGREILLQKMRGLRRFLLVFLVPLITVAAMKAYVAAGDYSRQPNAWVYLAYSVALALVYLPMLAWVCFWIGLRLRRRVAAVIVSLVVLVAWNVLPLFIFYTLDQTQILRTDSLVGSFAVLLSPLVAVGCNEDGAFRHVYGDLWAVAMLANIAWHLGILYFVRTMCLRNADRYLGRAWRRAERFQGSEAGDGFRITDP